MPVWDQEWPPHVVAPRGSRDLSLSWALWEHGKRVQGRDKSSPGFQFKWKLLGRLHGRTLRYHLIGVIL